MRVIDADGHVEENLQTFSEKYLDPAFRSMRPRVTGIDGLAYWVIEEQLYPRQFDLIEGVTNHMCLKVACSPRIDLDFLSSRCLNSFRVSACLDVALDYSNAELSAESLDSSLQ